MILHHVHIARHQIPPEHHSDGGDLTDKQFHLPSRRMAKQTKAASSNVIEKILSAA
jgi:hypothetical protein